MIKLRQELRTALGYFWNKVFSDQEFIDGSTASVAMCADAIIDLENELPSYSSRKLIPALRRYENRLFVFNELDMLNSSAYYGDGTRYDGTQMHGTFEENPDKPKFKAQGFNPRYLAVNIQDASVIYARDVDYTVTKGIIEFHKSPFKDSRITKEAVTHGDRTYRYILMWGVDVEEDIGVLCGYFGTVAGVCSGYGEELKKAVNIAWDLRLTGLSTELLKDALSYISGTDYSKANETVVDVYLEGDRRYILTDQNLYSAPLLSEPVVSVGQDLAPGTLLFDSFITFEKGQDIPFDCFEALALGPGFLEGIVGGILFPNHSVPITRYAQEGWYYVDNSGGELVKRDGQGRIIGQATAEDIENAPEKYFYIPLKGTQDEVEQVMDRLNSKDAEGISFFDQVAARHGSMPSSLNPLKEIRASYLGSRSIFIKLNRVVVDPDTFSQLANVMSRCVSAGTVVFIVTELDTMEEHFTAAGLAESIDTFYIGDVEDTNLPMLKDQIMQVTYL